MRQRWKQLLDDPALTPVTALLLADGGAAELNPPEWIEKLRPQVVLLSAAADDPAPDPEVLDALAGLHPAAHGSERLDRADHGWGADVGGGGEEVRGNVGFRVWCIFINGYKKTALNPTYALIDSASFLVSFFAIFSKFSCLSLLNPSGFI